MKKALTCLLIVGTVLSLCSACGDQKASTEDASASTSPIASNDTAAQEQPVSVTYFGALQNAGAVGGNGMAPFFALTYQQDGSEIDGYMDIEGKVSAYPPTGTFENQGNAFTIWGENGQESYTSPAESTCRILCSGDGKYLIAEQISNIDQNGVYVSVIDAQGKTLIDPIDYTELRYDMSATYVGDGFFALNSQSIPQNSNLYLLDGNTGKTFCLENTQEHGMFYNGSMAVHSPSGTFGLPECVSLVKTDGTVTSIAEGVSIRAFCEAGFLTSANGLTFYDYTGSPVWTFNQYEISNNTIHYADGFFIVYVIGADGQEYALCLDAATGEAVGEPIVCYKNRYVLQNQYLMTSEDGMLVVYDLTQGTQCGALDIDSDAFADLIYREQGLYVFQTDAGYLFYTAAGERLEPHS